MERKKERKKEKKKENGRIVAKPILCVLIRRPAVRVAKWLQRNVEAMSICWMMFSCAALWRGRRLMSEKIVSSCQPCSPAATERTFACHSLSRFLWLRRQNRRRRGVKPRGMQWTCSYLSQQFYSFKRVRCYTVSRSWCLK
jgi:hypothetical protein